MNSKTKLIQVAAACLMLGATHAVAQDDEFLLQITTVKVKMGHDAKFREGVMAYKNCYAENAGAGNWTTWAAVDGEGGIYHFVSRHPNWAQMDAEDAAGDTCWPQAMEQISPHMESVHNRFARSLSDWSGEGSGFSVVRLHQFRVDDGDLFRETVGKITAAAKAADYPHLGNWYSYVGNDSSEPDYFVAALFENFAAMDEDRNLRAAVAGQLGEEATDQLWDDFGESLEDDNEYIHDMLRLVSDLGYQKED